MAYLKIDSFDRQRSNNIISNLSFFESCSFVIVIAEDVGCCFQTNLTISISKDINDLQCIERESDTLNNSLFLMYPVSLTLINYNSKN